LISSENTATYGSNRTQSVTIDATLALVSHLIDGDIMAAAEDTLKKVRLTNALTLHSTRTPVGAG
jgi:hypothetical protein